MATFAKFEIYNFEPDSGVTEKVNQTLSLVVQRVPTDANCTAIIEKIGNYFLFEITLRTDRIIFCKKVRVGEREGRCRELSWQVNVVDEMAWSLVQDIDEFYAGSPSRHDSIATPSDFWMI